MPRHHSYYLNKQTIGPESQKMFLDLMKAKNIPVEDFTEGKIHKVKIDMAAREMRDHYVKHPGKDEAAMVELYDLFEINSTSFEFDYLSGEIERAKITYTY